MFSFALSTTPAPSAASSFSLHDALPIYRLRGGRGGSRRRGLVRCGPHCLPVPFAATLRVRPDHRPAGRARSEEHTSELQSRGHLVCRLLLEKKKPHINDQMIKILILLHL